MLKTLSSLSGSHLGKIANKVNDEIVKGENRSNGNIFTSKKLEYA